MSGQAANLSLKEAKAMQDRVQHSGSHARSNGMGHGSKTGIKMGKKESKSSACPNCGTSPCSC